MTHPPNPLYGEDETFRRVHLHFPRMDDIENHMTLKGKNEYRHSNTVVKVSQPHPSKVTHLKLDVELDDTNNRIAAFILMLDQLNQGVRRNHDERHHGGFCVVLIDRHIGIVSENSGYTATVCGRERFYEGDFDPNRKTC